MTRILATLAVAAITTSPALATEHRVTIQDMAFHPSVIAAEVGDTVIFANADDLPHTATAIARGLDTARARGGAFDTGMIDPAGSVAIRITRSGVVDFSCDYHPSMHGRIVAE